ncbi:hypothetical protein SLS53_009456 [Cytospora paraplurivora]|uniref:Alkyl hydroperoxide reductase subunit C/ Thiol specific antioxidant domain-containing protein n=1 Tax=Cytospora paraplurivora TaxID=2898453 RepID=A0AAN9TWJ0_9PEZI
MAPTLGEIFSQEFQSFKTPPAKQVAPVPKVGEPAPKHEKLKLDQGKPTIIVFLRHCGCPFAEKTFRDLTAFSIKHHPQIHCVAVSHSDQTATDSWVEHVGGAWETDLVVDEDRDVYAAWGLGLSSYWHAVHRERLRWQTSGAFAVDKNGVVKWAAVARSASEIPDLDAALRALIEVPTEVS